MSHTIFQVAQFALDAAISPCVIFTGEQAGHKSDLVKKFISTCGDDYATLGWELLQYFCGTRGDSEANNAIITVNISAAHEYDTHDVRAVDTQAGG